MDKEQTVYCIEKTVARRLSYAQIPYSSVKAKLFCAVVDLRTGAGGGGPPAEMTKSEWTDAMIKY